MLHFNGFISLSLKRLLHKIIFNCSYLLTLAVSTLNQWIFDENQLV